MKDELAVFLKEKGFSEEDVLDVHSVHASSEEFDVDVLFYVVSTGQRYSVYSQEEFWPTEISYVATYASLRKARNEMRFVASLREKGLRDGS